MPYKSRKKSDETNKEGGYKGVVYFSKTSDITTWARPTPTPTVLGDKYKINTAHSFATGAGAVSLVTKRHSVTTTAETTGDDGSKSLIHKAKFILLGDSASTLETVTDQLNDDLVYWVKDQDCLNTTEFVQFGDDCTPVDVSVTFDGKTTKEGQKEYTVELSVKSKKFFYAAALTEQPSSVAGPVVSSFSGYTGAVGSTLFIYVVASSAAGRPLTYQWYQGSTAVTGATRDFYTKTNAQLADAGNWYCKVTDDLGNTINSSVISVSIT